LVFVLKKDSDFLKKIKWEEILTHPFKVAWSHVNSQVGRHIFGHLPIEPLTEILDSHPIRVFRQMGQTLLQEARFKAADWIKKSKVKMVLDLYCGTGDFSLLLPKEIEWLGIELSKDAAEYAKIIRPNNQAFAGKVEHRLGDLRLIDLIKSPYSLYLNPPRMGIQDVAKEKLKNLFILNAPEVIAYLSCSASSLSRGLEFFESQNYKVHMLQPYDFFPQTEHFETLALLKKN
jgi:tRNA/tmRNA/rRNA uracil-C5-methylase (TrmA/RlmC/RlmD family)